MVKRRVRCITIPAGTYAWHPYQCSEPGDPAPAALAAGQGEAALNQ